MSVLVSLWQGFWEGKGGSATPLLRAHLCPALLPLPPLLCPRPAESPTKGGSRRRRPGQPPAAAAAHRALMVVFQRGRQVWSQGASLASLGEEVGQGI